MKQLKIWIEALRLRTLPVSLSGVVIAVALAHYLGCLQWTPAVLCLLFAGGIALIVPLAIIGLAVGILKTC